MGTPKFSHLIHATACVTNHIFLNCLLTQDLSYISAMTTDIMLAVGLEPTRSYEQRILSPHRIPIPTCQLIARLFVKLHLTIQTQLKLANTIRLDLRGTAFTFRCIGSIQELQFAPCKHPTENRTQIE